MFVSCLAAAVWRLLSLSPSCRHREHGEFWGPWKFPGSLGTREGPISHPRRLATAHKRQSTGICSGSKRHPGVRRVWSAPCARHEDAQYTTKEKERPLRRRQNEKRPAPFCASRARTKPRGRLPFYDSSTLPARATGRASGRRVDSESTRRTARPHQRRPTATMMHWQLLTWPKEGRPPGSISATMPRSADPAMIMMVAQPTTDARHNRAPPH